MAYNIHSDHDSPVDADPTAWPSSYYGRTKRIDLAKVYSDTLLRVNQAQEQKKQRKQQKARRQVSFTTAPPVIHEYEQEDMDDFCRNRRRYDDAGQLRIQTLDLRPIPNTLYNHPPQPLSASVSPTSSSQVDYDDHSSVDDDILLFKTNSRSRSSLAALFSLKFYSHYRKKQQCCK
ncbi:hypothetical protein BJV82DRAFT_670657 [Fennellomyces sp. T-0311]|nr:hypothetical protein BJV82DRAFT_670657 [Fennellomyces sp. T-0311]